MSNWLRYLRYHGKRPPAPPAPVPSPPSGPGPLVDQGGWTVYTPKPANQSIALTDFINQPGSRINLIDSNLGNDSTAIFYMMHPSGYVIDQRGSATDEFGVPYGNDPFNPQGKLYPYRSFWFCGPRYNGSPPGTYLPSDWVGNLSYQLNQGRNNKTDWWLFKRGETFNLRLDIVDGTLTVPQGESTTYRSVVGAYGAYNIARPRFTPSNNGFIARHGFGDASLQQFKNVHYVSLHFDGHTRIPSDEGYAINILMTRSGCQDIQFEDCNFDGTRGINWRLDDTSHTDHVSAPALTVNRCLGLYSWAKANFCIFMYAEQGGPGTLKILDSILLLNGYETADPSITMPPNTVYGRTAYIADDLNSVDSEWKRCIVMGGNSAEQQRCGMKIEDNVFVSGGITIGGNGGIQIPNTGSFRNNFFQKWMDPSGGSANPAGGVRLMYGAHHMMVENNLVSTAGLTVGEKASDFAKGMPAISVGDTPGGWPAHRLFPTASLSNTIKNNRIYMPEATWTHITVDNGANGSSGNPSFNMNPANGTCTWLNAKNDGSIVTQTMPTVSNNIVEGNNIAVGGGVLYTYNKGIGSTAPAPERADTTTITGGGGTRYATLAAYQSAVPTATDPTRTVKRYLLEVCPVEFPPGSILSKEGAQELAAWVKDHMQKNPAGGSKAWDARFTAPVIRNWIFAGHGMTAV